MQSRSSRNKSRCMEFRLRNLSLCNVCCLKMYIFIFFLLFFFSVYRINGGFRFRGGCHSNRCLHSEGSGRTVTSYDAMKTSNTDTSCLYTIKTFHRPMYEISLLTDSNTDHLHVAPAQQRHKVHTPGRGK